MEMPTAGIMVVPAIKGGNGAVLHGGQTDKLRQLVQEADVDDLCGIICPIANRRGTALSGQTPPLLPTSRMIGRLDFGTDKPGKDT